MSENNQQARTVNTNDRDKLDLQALVLLAVLLAAGFILNFTVGKAISSISGGMISPEFIISAAVIQITTTSPFIDFAAEGVAAMLMAGIVGAASKKGSVSAPAAAVATFVTTAVSGLIFMVIKIAMVGAAEQLAAAMTPVVLLTAVFNAILVGALYVPIKKALKLND